MATFNNRQLLLLSHLIYGVRRAHFDANGTVKVAGVVSRLIDELDRGRIPKHPLKTSKKEWRAILELISKDAYLSKCQISQYFRKNGMKVAVVRERKFFARNTAVIFRGSTIESDWEDNALGVYQSDTPLQKMALRYVCRVSLFYQTRVVVAGHSKGGNYAQYCAIRSGAVERAVSFDSQGFSPEFVEKYAEKINFRAKKIHNISAARDVVHRLLITLPEIRQTFVKSPKLGAFFMYHKFNALIDLETGKFHPRAKSEEKYTHVLRDATKTLVDMTVSQRKKCAHGIMSIAKVGVAESRNIIGDLLRAVSAIPDLLRLVFGLGKRLTLKKKLKKKIAKMRKSGALKRYALIVLILIGVWNR